MSDVKARIDEHVKLFEHPAFAGIHVESMLRSGALMALYALDAYLHDERMKRVAKSQKPAKHRDLTRWIDRERKALAGGEREATT